MKTPLLVHVRLGPFAHMMAPTSWWRQCFDMSGQPEDFQAADLTAAGG